jgi:hypothetical protein
MFSKMSCFCSLAMFRDGKKYLLPKYMFGSKYVTFFNRNNQTFTKLRNILKEYFLKPRIGYSVFKNRSN